MVDSTTSFAGLNILGTQSPGSVIDEVISSTNDITFTTTQVLTNIKTVTFNSDDSGDETLTLEASTNLNGATIDGGGTGAGNDTLSLGAGGAFTLASSNIQDVELIQGSTVTDTVTIGIVDSGTVVDLLADAGNDTLTLMNSGGIR